MDYQAVYGVKIDADADMLIRSARVMRAKALEYTRYSINQCARFERMADRNLDAAARRVGIHADQAPALLALQANVFPGQGRNGEGFFPRFV